jgi:hypothetical protein
MRPATLITIIVAALIVPTRAMATTDDLSAPETESYAYRLMAADAVSLGAMLIGGVASNGWVASAGVTGLFLAAPVVHLTEGRAPRPWAAWRCEPVCRCWEWSPALATSRSEAALKHHRRPADPVQHLRQGTA